MKHEHQFKKIRNCSGKWKMSISILHPSRGRPHKSNRTITDWISNWHGRLNIEIIVSIDSDDSTKQEYKDIYKDRLILVIENDNRSAIDAINNAAKVSIGDILMVVSDDTEHCGRDWDDKLFNEVREGSYLKKDWILKTEDGIQDYIITNPILDRIYYNRLIELQGGLYHPGFQHLFPDTFLTCQADILGKKITSKLMFRHNHYSHSGGKEGPDELHKRNDATWSQGEELFIKLINQYSIEDRRKISDFGMKNWLRRKGVQI